MTRRSTKALIVAVLIVGTLAPLVQTSTAYAKSYRTEYTFHCRGEGRTLSRTSPVIRCPLHFHRVGSVTKRKIPLPTTTTTSPETTTSTTTTSPTGSTTSTTTTTAPVSSTTTTGVTPACAYTLPLTPSTYNTTPSGPGPWTVPTDPCNTEGRGYSNIYENCAYWGAEKRPDIWTRAVWIYGYTVAPTGAWDIELDAAEAGFSIDHTPQVGDLVAWPPNAVMGTDSNGGQWTASPGGHVAYVEAVNSASTITVSEMGVDSDPVGGYTSVLTYNPSASYFIHQ
jgi:surface antigen